MSSARFLGIQDLGIRALGSHPNPGRVRALGATARALILLVGGTVLALTGLVWISQRITATVELSQSSFGDFASLYLLGDGTAIVGALAVAASGVLVLLAGVVLASIGYARIVIPGPSPTTIRHGVSAFAHPKQIQLSAKGEY